MSAAVDLVIPNLDGEALLGACLEAVAAQTLAPARVIVVDSGSVDGSRAIAEAYGAEWHALPANNGFAAAVNHGIASSDSPYVALLNNDAVPEPGWLAALVEALERDSALSFAASRMLFTGERGVNAAGDGFDVRGRGGYNRGIREPDGPRFDEPRIVFGACAGAALYRRTLFHDIGLFDEQLFLSWEDVDLDLRAALAGHRCLYVPTRDRAPRPGRVVGRVACRAGTAQQGHPGAQGPSASRCSRSISRSCPPARPTRRVPPARAWPATSAGSSPTQPRRPAPSAAAAKSAAAPACGSCGRC